MFYINKKQKKVLFVATVVKTHINVFHLPYLEMFKNKGFKTYVCAKNDFENKEDCIIPYCDEYYDIPFERSPFNLKNLKAYIELKKIIEKEKFDIIHCHTPVASILTRIAAIKSRKSGTKVIYTAHGFHFFKGAPIINWLIYYPIEKICSYLTDILITINKEDYNLAINKMKSKEVYYIPGVGIDIKKFSNIDISKKRKEIGIDDNIIMLLSVGELIKRKNHEIIIKALSKLEDEKIHYFIAGSGELKDYLTEIAEKFNLSNRVHILGFRNDIGELCKIADVFCFPSLQEGLPVALMEAMAVGVPIVCSNIRGNTDLIENNINGYLCYKNSEDEFKNAIKNIINDPEKSNNMVNINIRKSKLFEIDNVMDNMKLIYKL